MLAQIRPLAPKGSPDSRVPTTGLQGTSDVDIHYYLCMIIRPLRMLGKMAAAVFYHLIPLTLKQSSSETQKPSKSSLLQQIEK